MSSTTIVKAPVIPQWNSFSVTAPSGLVPWPAFYDGTETVTVIWQSPLPITNTWWFINNYEYLSATWGTSLQHRSSYNTWTRYFMFVVEKVLAGTNNTRWYIYELDTWTNTRIIRPMRIENFSVFNPPVLSVHKLPSNTWVRFSFQYYDDLNPAFDIRRYNDYTFSTNTYTWVVSQATDPWIWLTQMPNLQFDSIWWYTYQPYVSRWNIFWAGLLSSTIVTVTTI